MTYKEVLAEARKHIGPKCKACPECNGLGCGNTIPGPGSKAPGNGANDNWKAWRPYKLNMNTMVPNTPVDTGIELFGRRIQLPLLTDPSARFVRSSTLRTISVTTTESVSRYAGKRACTSASATACLTV